MFDQARANAQIVLQKLQFAPDFVGYGGSLPDLLFDRRQTARGLFESGQSQGDILGGSRFRCRRNSDG